jgi:toxin-antitoxin system PIN domain toxin
MIAVDTNILVYAHRPESAPHSLALASLDGLHATGSAWGIPVHCLVEFAAVVSNPRIWRQPSSPDAIADQASAWLECRGFRLLGDDAVVWSRTHELAARGHISGAAWYDARIAAVCLAHGVRELWTADRDYSSFPALRTRNPLVA